jgi:predicted metal-binding membrane protein
MESAAARTTPSLPALTRAGVAGALVAAAAGAWALTAERMAGMDAAPGADLGGAGWFAVSWLVMMAAMMLPALVPAALALARDRRHPVAPFVATYLLAWTAAGIVLYLLLDTARPLVGGFLAWDRAGRYLAAGVLLAAAVYQLTAAKARCLERCTTPARLAAQVPAGVRGSLLGGLRHGAWCIGCCAGLMAALFALGLMSLTWMVAIAALIAGERLLGWRQPAVYAVAGLLAAAAIWMVLAPGSLPGLTLPGAMPGM